MTTKNLLPLQLLVIIVAACTRLAPHPVNFTPVLAIGLFSGFYFKSRLFSLAVPLSVMIVSDFFIGYYLISFWVYTAIAGIAFIAWSINKYTGKKYLILSSFFSSVFFFIVSNFGVWTLGGYGYSLEGLISCYILAIPFFFNTLASTFIYTLIFFGSYELIARTYMSSITSDSVIDH
ncbi:MAG: hypothetical protein CBD58_00755 [bacterium TMED198]|nr:MAG: hypothetical protein CBD58_00755 [bacterium TMED198]